MSIGSNQYEGLKCDEGQGISRGKGGDTDYEQMIHDGFKAGRKEWLKSAELSV